MTNSTLETALARVKELAATFGANEDRYGSPEYQEAEVRKDFIDKFLIALGWDVNHERQTNPYAQEAKVERAQGGTQRRADYAFYLDPNYRDVRFYVEAKKPHGELVTPGNCFQTIRYGYSSGNPLAVLTDFRHFCVLDCRRKPDIASAHLACLQKFHYSEYSDRESFARIYWLFSREAVAGGSLDKYSKELPKARGRAVQLELIPGAYKPVDESLLEDLDDYRMTLARMFKSKNQDLEGYALTEIVQRTLDRLIFMRFLEDKLIEERALLDSFGDRGPAWRDFAAAARRLDRIYNGIVFKKHDVLDSPDFKVDDAVFAGLCAELGPSRSPYDFDAIPIHILGSIYERFLGKVIVATEKRARVEAKPEARKAGGVYYTPEYVVRYIVENTVGKLIEGKSPGQIAEMRFADIACGSGSFLLGVYDYLLEYHGRYYNAHPKTARKGDCVERDGRLYLSLHKKREILVNNIYGVDIDFQAVEVAQVSLYLHLLKDESIESTHAHQLEFKETLLPALNHNIVCGNSLIDAGIFDSTSLGEPKERKLRPLSFETIFPRAARSGGFDAVVGNPPYVLLQGEFRDDDQLAYFRNRYRGASYKIDLYHLFIERGIGLTKRGGYCSMITPSNYLTNNYLGPLRRIMLDEAELNHILVLDGGVFRGASVDNAIFVAKAGGTTKKPFSIIHTTPADGILETLSRAAVSPESVRADRSALFAGREEGVAGDLWSRAVLCGTPLKDIAHVNFGKQLRDRSKFEKDVIKITDPEKIPKGYRPCHTGGDVTRYHLAWNGLACLNNAAARRGGCWDPARQDAVNKLITRQIGANPNFALDSNGYQCLNTVFMVNIHAKAYHPLFLIGVLNSSLLRRLWLDRFRDRRKTFPKIKGTYLEQLPIRKINFGKAEDRSAHEALRAKVEQMIDARKRQAAAKAQHESDYYRAKCAALDKAIDRLVYDLYGLTDDEIGIVENSEKER